MAEKILQEMLTWLQTSGVRILAIAVLSYVVIRLLRVIATRVEKFVEGKDPSLTSEGEKRAKTLAGIVRAVGTAGVGIVALLMILPEVGMDITPIIAGAGVAGLAIGFGAQSLIKDVISGFFILLENQFGVGDVIRAAGVAGQVERMTLRITVLRDLEGVVHMIPNGEIKEVSNLTKEWSRAVLDIAVAYKEDVDRVIAILNEVGTELSRDPIFGRLILEGPQVLGVDAFGESQVTIRVLVKTLPLKQWDVAREFRRRIKNTFDARGIEIPFPHRVAYLRVEDSLLERLRGASEKAL